MCTYRIVKGNDWLCTGKTCVDRHDIKRNVAWAVGTSNSIIIIITILFRTFFTMNRKHQYAT